jgi:hypothetical protein
MTSPAILEQFRAKLEGLRGTDRIAVELAIPRRKEEIVAAEEEMRALAYQLCKTDYPRMPEAMKKLTEWKEQPWRIRGGHVPVEECIEARQRIIIALSAEEIEELSERYLNRWRPLGRSAAI